MEVDSSLNAFNTQTGLFAELSARIRSGDFLDQLRTGIMLFDANGAILDCNQAATGMLGVTLDELKDHTSFDWPLRTVRDDGSTFPSDEYASAIAIRTGEPCFGVIMGVDNPGQPRRWLWMDGYPLIIDGRVEGAAIWIDDVTDRRQHRHALELLTEVNRHVLFASDGVDPLQLLCDALVKHGHYGLVWIGVTSKTFDGGVDTAFASGVTDYLYEGIASWSGARDTGLGIVGTAMRTGLTQVGNDLATHLLLEPWRERVAQFGLNSAIAIPFTPAGQRAVLTIYDRHVFAFDETTVKGLEEIAREAEFAINHLHSVRQLAAALEGTLSALGHMTDARDPYTGNHQNRVGSLGAAIATRLGLDARMIALIRQSGEVHDIGKIAVPSEILTRPGRLSTLEFEMVKGHTTVGFDILTRAKLPWPIAEVALQHHERLDGSGYPSGLVAGEIILPARILAVADVVEAMSQHRPYRPALGIDLALAEVSAGAGTLYDSEVVDACHAEFDAGFTF